MVVLLFWTCNLQQNSFLSVKKNYETEISVIHLFHAYHTRVLSIVVGIGWVVANIRITPFYKFIKGLRVRICIFENCRNIIKSQKCVISRLYVT